MKRKCRLKICCIMHLTSYTTLLFHCAFLILNLEVQPTGLGGYANTVFLYSHLHHYCVQAATHPASYFTLQLMELWALLAALPCFHSWDTEDTEILNCAQRSWTTWCRMKRGVRGSAMCERAQHTETSPTPIHGQPPERDQAKDQSRSKAPREATAGARDGGPTPIPSSHPSLPAQYISECAYNNSLGVGEGSFRSSASSQCVHVQT